MKDRYFITGGSGFVGANVVRALVSGGEHVAILSRSKKLNRYLSDLNGSCTVYEGDMLTANFSAVFKQEKPTVIFHLAAYGAMPQERDFRVMVDVNVKGLMRILAGAQRSTVRLFVNTGSSSEYGLQKKKMKETDILAPVNDYGVAKAAATLLAQKVAMNSSFSLVTLRLFSPYGYFEQPTRFIPSVIRSAITGEPFPASSPSFVRDFVFVGDVARAYLSVVNTHNRSLNGQIVNIGSGHQHRLGDVVVCVEKIIKRKIDIRWNKNPVQERQIEPKLWEADITKAGRLLHWKPAVSLESGLKKTIAWMKP
jgi:nucleoside-diphosphate-sugar epimerase